MSDLKLSIKGDLFDPTTALTEASLETIEVMEIESAKGGRLKVTPGVVNDLFTKTLKGVADGTVDPSTLMDDALFRAQIRGLIFLAKRTKDDTFTWADAGKFPPGSISWVAEVDEDADPKDDPAVNVPTS